MVEWAVGYPFIGSDVYTVYPLLSRLFFPRSFGNGILRNLGWWLGVVGDLIIHSATHTEYNHHFCSDEILFIISAAQLGIGYLFQEDPNYSNIHVVSMRRTVNGLAIEVAAKT